MCAVNLLNDGKFFSFGNDHTLNTVIYFNDIIHWMILVYIFKPKYYFIQEDATGSNSLPKCFRGLTFVLR